MNCNEIIFFILNILCIFTMFGLSLYYGIFLFASLFFRKKFPKANEKLKYCIMIPARNEELVIGKLIQSIREADYPQDKLDIYCMAHNCTDNTAKVAKDNGAIVYEYNNKKEAYKSYAMKQLINNLKKDNLYNKYDGFFTFDADNLVEKNFFSKMNNAFIANGKNCVITSYRNSKNFNNSLIASFIGLSLICENIFRRGKVVCNCTTIISGTGYLIGTNVLNGIWNYFCITEDLEASLHWILDGIYCYYCDEAEIYDEQPEILKTAIKQQLRWARGHFLMFLAFFPKIFKSIFSKKNKNQKFSSLSFIDLSIFLVPLSIKFLISLFIFILFPIFDESSEPIFSYYINGCISGIITCFIINFLGSSMAILIESKRLKQVNIKTRILTPIFMAVWNIFRIFIYIIAIFLNNIKWEPIPHTYNITNEAINKN